MSKDKSGFFNRTQDMPPAENDWHCIECHKQTSFKDVNLFSVDQHFMHDAGVFMAVYGLVCDECDPRPKGTKQLDE